MAPAREGLDTQDPTGGGLDLRLVVEKICGGADGVAQSRMPR